MHRGRVQAPTDCADARSTRQQGNRCRGGTGTCRTLFGLRSVLHVLRNPGTAQFKGCERVALFGDCPWSHCPWNHWTWAVAGLR